jgi:phytol kinase
MSGVFVQIAVVIGSVAALLVAISGIRVLGARFDWSPEVRRKAVHVTTGCFAMLFPILFQDRWPVALLVCASIAVMVWMRMPSQRQTGLGSTIHSVERKSWGDVLLALTIGFLFFRSQGTPILYVLPLAVITLSDSAAALAGSAYGRRLFVVEKGQKSFEGVAVFFVVAWLASLIMLLLFTDTPRPNVVLLGLTTAAFGALVEADSWNGLDNLFVPIGIYVFLRANLQANLADIGLLAGGFIATVAAFMALAPTLRVSAHAARGYAIVVFLLASFSGALAAFLPVGALVAHIYARTQRPCNSPYPDLDLIAAVVGIACIWLFVGEAIGPSAIHFFMLTYAGVILIYLTLALGAKPLPATLLVPPLLALFSLLMEVANPATHWYGSITMIALGSLCACAIIACWRPALFDRWRAPRIALAAAFVPLVAYFAKAMT